MAFKTIPAPSCPDGHPHSQVHSQGSKQRKSGTTRMWHCRWVAPSGTQEQHFFSTRTIEPSPRELLDKAVPMPTCGDPEHTGWTVKANGTYDTLAGPRQRYCCTSPDEPKVRHTFTAPLPRSVVEDDICCRDTEIDDLVEATRGKATTDPGYIELDMWYTGQHQRARDARAAAARRKARPTPKGLRCHAPVELRPPDVRHTYRLWPGRA